MKNTNNFQIAKVQPQGVAQHLLNFFANFSLALLIKVLSVLEECFGFFETANSQNSRLFLTGFYLFSESNNHYFDRTVEHQLPKSNR